MITRHALLVQKCIWVGYAVSACLAVIFFRLFYLQVYETAYYQLKGQKNFLRVEKTRSVRGNILDINGNLLATNRPITNISWQGTGNPQLSTAQQNSITLLESIIPELADPEKNNIKKIRRAERYRTKASLAYDISFEQLSKIKEQLAADPNITFETHYKRYYPYKSLACHILGYIGQVDLEACGRMGLEKVLEESLKGEQGQRLHTMNSVGRSLQATEIKKALDGKDIITTIDIDLQEIVERVFPEYYCGTFIVMDPQDGSLVAVLSRPNFDPTIFLNPIDNHTWFNLQENQRFLNRAFNACYPPGSIFKLVSVSAALEQRMIETDTILNCKGFVEFAGRKYWCHKRYGHGNLTTQQAVAESCNTLFFEIGKKISIDTLAEYAYKFGYGKKTHALFAQKEGLVPSTHWRLAKGERWWPGETLSASIGQSCLLVTPVQVACMISSIFTGNLVNPRILIDEPVYSTPLDLQPETLSFLRDSMRSVVTQGTGKNVSKIKDIEIYAKTSTAQTSSYEKRDWGEKYLEHGWFVMHFKYKDYQPLTVVTLVEHAGSSKHATNIAKQFLIEYKKLMDLDHTLSRNIS